MPIYLRLDLALFKEKDVNILRTVISIFTPSVSYIRPREKCNPKKLLEETIMSEPLT